MSFEPDKIVTNPFVVGFAGALLGLRAWPGTTWAEKVSNIALGFAVAVVVGPAVVDYLHISSERIGAAIIFSCGAAGLVVFAALIDGIKQTKFGEWIASWLPRRPS